MIELPGINIESKSDDTLITIRGKFPPGSIAVFETWIPAAEHAAGLDTYVTSEAKTAFADVDLVDLNFISVPMRDGGVGFECGERWCLQYPRPR